MLPASCKVIFGMTSAAGVALGSTLIYYFFGGGARAYLFGDSANDTLSVDF